MNLFEYFYCRAYDYYNTTGKKSNVTLRVNSINCITLFQLFNILTVVFTISLLRKGTIGNKWVGLLLVILLLIYNYIRISKQKSEMLRAEYATISIDKKKRLKILLTAYIFITSLLFLTILTLTVYYKKKYGNYDA